MIEENTILKQITVLPEQNAINVQWANQIIKDGEVIAEKLHRKAYSCEQKDAFLTEVDGATNYISILGW